mgnify:CR=1 FL=1
MPLLKVVDRDGREHDVPARSGQKLMETLRELDYGISAICGGMCSCATCHVYIERDWVSKLPPPERQEKEMLDFALATDPITSRLTCQIRISAALEGLVVHMPAMQA